MPDLMREHGDAALAAAHRRSHLLPIATVMVSSKKELAPDLLASPSLFISAHLLLHHLTHLSAPSSFT
jgi:hypothetical protein